MHVLKPSSWLIVMGILGAVGAVLVTLSHFDVALGVESVAPAAPHRHVPSLANATAVSLTTVTIRDAVQVPDVKRLGLNLGSRDRWGAGQFLKNLIANPGFEAGVYGSVAHAAEGSSGSRFVQDFWDTTWNNDLYGIGQPEGFWNGAAYEIVYGPAQGRSGTITNFTHEDNHNVFYLDPDGTAPEQWDVMFVRQTWDGVAGVGEWASADTTTIRPDSPGEQSLHMIHTGESWRSSYAFYMDSFWRDGERSAGKLFLVQGNWRLEFWAKGAQDGDQLRARFFREGEADFFDETVSLTAAWQKYTFDTLVPEGTDALGPYTPDEYHPILGFTFIVPEAGDEAWVDDVALYSTDHANPTVFTDAFVNRLKEFQPGVLRDWSNQFGSTLDVQLAEPWARQTQGYRPHERVPGAYSYSLHEFLELCQEVGAEPWYVIPPTFSPQDLANLVEYLVGPADGAHPYADRRATLGQSAPWTEVFATIHLEFGNELWGAASGGDPFFGASLLGGTRLGQIAHDRFALLQSSPHYDPSRLNLIIGGQAGYPGRQEEIDQNSSNHDTIALAPYFGVLDDYADDEEIFYPLFARPFDDVATGRMRQSQDFVDGVGQGTELAVYELNFHTTHGDAPLNVRNDYVTGMGGAVALPLHMLVYLRDLGSKEQCAFAAAQFAFRMDDGEYVRLWGMLRDLEATGRKRPTWLGVELANRAIRGDMLVIVQGGDNPGWHQAPINGVGEEIDVDFVQSFAFRDGDQYATILFNLSLDAAQEVRLGLPLPPKPQATQYQLAPASIHDDNEEAENVVVQTQSLVAFTDEYTLTLPPHSVTVLTWEALALELSGRPGDGEIHLDWKVNTTLPLTSGWQLDYESETGTALLPPISIPTSTVRSHTFTGLTNYVWYTVTLNAVLDSTPLLTDTVRVMPTDQFLYLPLVLRGE